MIRIPPETAALQFAHKWTHQDLDFDQIRKTAPTCSHTEPNYYALCQNLTPEKIVKLVRHLRIVFPSGDPPQAIEADVLHKPPEYGKPTDLVVNGPLAGFVGQVDENNHLTVIRPLIALPITKYRHPNQIGSPLRTDFGYVSELSTRLSNLLPQFDQRSFLRNIEPSITQAQE